MSQPSPTPTLAAGTEAGRIYVFFTESPGGESKRTVKLEGHKGAVLTVAFARGETSLVSGGEDESVRLWEYDNYPSAPKEKWRFDKLDAPARVVRLSPDNRFLAAGCSTGNPEMIVALRLWKVATGAEIASFEKTKGVDDLAFASDGQFLYTVGEPERKNGEYYCYLLWNLGNVLK